MIKEQVKPSFERMVFELERATIGSREVICVFMIWNAMNVNAGRGIVRSRHSAIFGAPRSAAGRESFLDCANVPEPGARRRDDEEPFVRLSRRARSAWGRPHASRFRIRRSSSP